MEAWARLDIANITFFYVTSDHVTSHIKDLKLKERYQGVKTIEGTRSHHAYLPGQTEGTLRMYRVSSDIALRMFTNVHVKEIRTGLDEVCPGKYIACSLGLEVVSGDSTGTNPDHF